MKVCMKFDVNPAFKPRCLRAYKVNELLKPEVARQLQELLDMGKKVKFSHTRYRALGQELIPVYRQSARR